MDVFTNDSSALVSVFWGDGVSDLRRYLSFFLKYNRIRNTFSVKYFSVISGYGVLRTIYCGLFVFLESSTQCFFILFFFRRIGKNIYQSNFSSSAIFQLMPSLPFLFGPQKNFGLRSHFSSSGVPEM